MGFPWGTEEDVSSSVFQTRRKRHVNHPPQQLQKSLSPFRVSCKEMTSRRLRLRWRTWRKYVFLLTETATLPETLLLFCVFNRGSRPFTWTRSWSSVLIPFVSTASHDLSDHHFQLSSLRRRISCLVAISTSLPKLGSDCVTGGIRHQVTQQETIGKVI